MEILKRPLELCRRALLPVVVVALLLHLSLAGPTSGDAQSVIKKINRDIVGILRPIQAKAMELPSDDSSPVVEWEGSGLEPYENFQIYGDGSVAKVETADERFWNGQRGEDWTTYYTEQDVLDCAWVLWFEYGACESRTEKSKVVWTICNRVDDPRWADNFRGVVSAPCQFSWHGAPNTKRMSQDVIDVARDVLERWNAEKNGITNAGRTLPKDSIGFWGDGRRNHFYAQTYPGPRQYYEFAPEEGPYDN